MSDTANLSTLTPVGGPRSPRIVQGRRFVRLHPGDNVVVAAAVMPTAQRSERRSR
jgi:hypothetical protein